MKELHRYFSSRLKKLIAHLDYEENNIGCSESRVFYIKEIKAYLKVNPIGIGNSLKEEANALNHLKNSLPVPEVMHFEVNDKYEFLLMSEIEVIPSYEGIKDKPFETIDILAKGLKDIHNIPIGSWVRGRSKEDILESLKSNIKNGLVNTEEFEEENIGKTAQELFQELLEIDVDTDKDLVFTHGDHCMPNILIEDKQLAGFIDWGGCGITDRYQDIALVIRSLKFNGFKQEHIDYFINQYGIKDLDMNKVQFYILADELF